MKQTQLLTIIRYLFLIIIIHTWFFFAVLIFILFLISFHNLGLKCAHNCFSILYLQQVFLISHAHLIVVSINQFKQLLIFQFLVEHLVLIFFLYSLLLFLSLSLLFLVNLFLFIHFLLFIIFLLILFDLIYNLLLSFDIFL